MTSLKESVQNEIISEKGKILECRGKEASQEIGDALRDTGFLEVQKLLCSRKRRLSLFSNVSERKMR